MKTVVLTIVSLILLETVAWASCPPGTRYECQQGYNGKVICSCR